jgi:protoheme IX farnesyltransferase
MGNPPPGPVDVLLADADAPLVNAVEEPMVAPVAAAGRPPGALADLLSLTKPRLSALVLVTAGGGLWLTDRDVPLQVAIAAVGGTIAVVGGANALNCYLERETDRHMLRTRSRPLPAGRMAPATALAFGVALSLISVPVLTWLTSPLAGLLAAVALLTYVLVYTPLKRRSSLSTLVGALPGALPPLIGWTAATGALDPGGLILFAILFLWQIPHSLAIGTYRLSEYAQAGLVVFPIEHGHEATRRQALLYTLPLVVMPLALVHVGAAGLMTLTLGSALSLYFLWQVLRWYKDRLGDDHARKVFFASLIYLCGLFGVLGVDAILHELRG